ncbi:MAG: Transglutaminase-like superfamily protein [Candidatus Methanofastidiosum methylothiophilum]|uniref:Transglutaminase-like superfamily protein n=1 Tax=Candidatus Methanofastidiosum methylothiophilum TaxID=1705564 RepID=A0A150IRC2_9EURY|nr:MAG: Transglutaminase-like superfamily protein [Candidatus Methanofastidiosum methylthiophilus]KYC47520.1 MAG: Transglutaminase-like superfamily protein [Candidatus Methanofastidiosum methylthiophilus]KYC50420.1 MAG: Transglutaminase-like superfamily protein [Candidatus Methanofastidiosum methylthiophilus]
MKCLLCGNDTDLSYCPNCGNYPLEQEIIKCTKCGSDNSKELFYCSKCGAPIKIYATSDNPKSEKVGDAEKYSEEIEREEFRKKKFKAISSILLGAMLLLAIFYYLGLVNNPNSPIEHQLPQKYSAVITTKINNIDADVGEIKLWVALPIDCGTQQNVSIISIDPEPNKIDIFPEACTRVCYWDFNSSLPTNSSIVIIQKISFVANPFTTSIDPSLIEPYDSYLGIYNEYTKPSQRVESDDPDIIAMAKKVVGNEKNPYKKADRIYGWVVKNITYEIQDQELGARYAFYNRKGDCTEFATLFVAMCRSQGIPARLVHGYLYGTDTSAGHMWAEIYLPPYGWVPADPTGDHTTKSRFFFGRLGNNVLILSKGNVGLSPNDAEDIPFAFSYIAHYKSYNFGKLIFENNAELKKIN